jgi:ankyrin repeat protein
MFPNPQDALPLPPRPDLEQYRKLAKDLAKACRSDGIAAWTTRWLDALGRLTDRRITRQHAVVEDYARRQMTTTCALSNAQFVIARSHGFESWPKLMKHIDGLGKETSPIARFEKAADAIVRGDVATLKRLLRETPGLIRARSTREHRATLLHYVSANGVENFRQQSPKKAVQIAKLLLDAGAEVDADADVYGGGATTLGLVATSVHPEKAGVQKALLQALLDHGAAIDQPRAAGNAQDVVQGCLANGQPEAAAYLAAHGAVLTFETAAGLGRLELVERLLPAATSEEKTNAFIWACMYGRNGVVSFLLDQGVDVATHGHDRQTGLHCAVIGGQLETVQLLLRHNAPLGIRNIYGGTVLGQAAWCAANGGDPAVYARILETLTAAGADERTS